MANKKITELMAGTPTRDSLLESAIDYSGTMDSRKAKAGAIADLNNIIVAEEYDDTRTYVYGEYRINEGVLYRCTTPINVAEAWTSAHWTAVMVTGEYKRVRIMTKAQFDLLSNDEKDGFIYVSDYPTKIQDIDNVTLTTSDNNKLLGVSVSGLDISVEAVELTAADIPYSQGVSVADKLDDLSGIKITKTSLSAVFSNSNISANIGNAKTLFGLGNDDTIDYIGSFCNGQPLVAFTNSTGGLFCGAVLGQLNATYAFTAICFYH